MDFLRDSKDALLNKAADAIEKGKVIVSPTDTVYGFLARADNKKAVEKIYKIKKRPKIKPLAVFIKDIKMAKELADINAEQEKILKKHWPGRFTFILKYRKPLEQFHRIVPMVVGKNNTIAIRIPNHKFLHDLLNKINKPLAQTSVNISGKPTLTKISDIKEFIAGSGLAILIIDAGNLKKSKPSKIIDITFRKIVRLR